MGLSGRLYGILKAQQGPAGPMVVFGEFPVCMRSDCDAVAWVFANEEVISSRDVAFRWHSDDPQPEPKNLAEPPPNEGTEPHDHNFDE
jgi:hypothetical protein